ncbi:hypothetical protein [Algoriphagus sediminis]|uniref:Lysozyme inhibitor of I-type lysozyme n=1 Tax=Algoriphagus sediminis TaxID=3057113 RepID=A0ABT7YEQ5_9BACT|nr:hypothetical protein [Algoriphagus sediminis]MDN3205010.1 hypothetical protein [Algoriphagus sediminis]
MKNFVNLLLLIFSLQVISSCQSPTQNEDEQTKTEPSSEENSIIVDYFLGDYVTKSYQSRTEGSDWIVVRVSKSSDELLKVEVSSRADKKRPTCTWSTTTQIKDDKTLSTFAMEEEILIKVNGNTLNILAANPEEDGILNYFCGGGASLSGETYQKLSEPLDESQLKAFTIQKSNSLQGITFDISATEQNPNSEVIITPSGLEATNEPIRFETSGTLMQSEVEDLNSDGSPELILFFTMFGESVENYLKIFSGNNNKSISEVSIPDITEEQKKGYGGEEEWAVIETSVVARFPIFEEKDGEWVRTGKTRQIQYKLEDGENSRKLVVDKVIEY